MKPDLAPPSQPQELPRSEAPSPASPAVGAAVPVRGRSWVPVRTLTSRHRDRVRTHLLALDAQDRYLRFGFAASDMQVGHYADALDFDRDEIFGIFNRRLELIAMAHLAYAVTPQIGSRPAMAEFGVTVARNARRRGLGARLFDHAIVRGRNRGIQNLFVQALSENTAMLKIARNAGATLHREGSESEAWLALPPDDFTSHVGAMVEEQAAEWDYRLKAQAKCVHDIIEAFSDEKTNGGKPEAPDR